MNKKGFELSVNVLVVIIIGIVLLSAGFVLVKKIVIKSNNIMKDVDYRLQDEMRKSCFLDGRPICLLDPKAKVPRGKSKMFAFGFINNLQNHAHFSVYVVNSHHPSGVTDEKANSMIITAFDIDNNKLLEANEESFFWISFKAPNNAIAGQYTYDVYVCTDSDEVSIEDATHCSGSNNKLYTGTKQRLFITII